MRHYIVITTYAWDAYGMNGGLHDPGGEIITPIIPSYQGDTIEYCGNTVVVNGEVSRVAHDKGYITFDEVGDPLFHYYLRDHLGSVRVVFNVGIGSVNNGANHGPQDIINNATDLPAYR